MRKEKIGGAADGKGDPALVSGVTKEERVGAYGLIARFNEEIEGTGVVLEPEDRLPWMDSLPPWLRSKFSKVREGIGIFVEIGTEILDGKPVHVITRERLVKIETSIGLTDREVAHILELLRKEKFSVSEEMNLQSVREIIVKLQGFKELRLTDVVADEDADDEADPDTDKEGDDA